MDATGPNILHLTHHQQLVGGPLSFILHLFGTDLPVMTFIYSILLPRHAKLFSPMTAYLLGAVSYPPSTSASPAPTTTPWPTPSAR